MVNQANLFQFGKAAQLEPKYWRFNNLKASTNQQNAPKTKYWFSVSFSIFFSQEKEKNYIERSGVVAYRGEIGKL